MTRERLLSAALDCLVEFGYGGITTTAVCERAGLSRGAQLHHFPTKRELVVAAVEHLAWTRSAAIRARAAATFPSDGAKELVRDLVWSEFTGVLFYAAAELWQASRTDASLRTTLYRFEREFGREIHQLYADVFPPEISGAPWFHDALDTTLYLMRGLALTRILKRDPAEEERVLAVCADLFEHGRPGPDNQIVTTSERRRL